MDTETKLYWTTFHIIESPRPDYHIPNEGCPLEKASFRHGVVTGPVATNESAALYQST